MNPATQDNHHNEPSLETLLIVSGYLNLGLDETIKELIRQSKNLGALPYKFNELFSNQGWIATEDLSVPLMEKAIQILNNNGLAEAELFMCNSFNDDYFDLHSSRMNAIWVWDNNRSRLLNLAYIDHKEGRYHASIPVVLAQVDGLMYDISNKSFYSDKAIQESNDLISTQSTGLPRLSKKSAKPRNKTSARKIDFPYRHGILHGRELSYDNNIVSTKCFFILFALRTWALKWQQYEFDKQSGKNVEKNENFKPGDMLAKIIKEKLSD